jgi:hypothetical protein
VTTNKAKINFEKCPVAPWRFVILKIESKKKENSCRGRAKERAFFFVDVRGGYGSNRAL